MAFCKILPHPADLKIKLRAKSWKELIARSAQCFSFLILDSEDFNSCLTQKKIKIRLKGKDRKEQLVNFLNDLIFIFDTSRLLPRKGEVVSGVFKGEFFRVEESEIKKRIKSATFYELQVKERKKQIEVEVVFDV